MHEIYHIYVVETNIYVNCLQLCFTWNNASEISDKVGFSIFWQLILVSF